MHGAIPHLLCALLIPQFSSPILANLALPVHKREIAAPFPLLGTLLSQSG